MESLVAIISEPAPSGHEHRLYVCPPASQTSHTNPVLQQRAIVASWQLQLGLAVGLRGPA